MKKLLFLLCVIISSNPVFAIYDFLEPPDEYEWFKEYYDLRTEYWRAIPNYMYEEEEPVMEFKNINRVHKERKVIIKDTNQKEPIILIQ